MLGVGIHMKRLTLWIKKVIDRIVCKAGYNIIKSVSVRRQKLFNSFGIDVVLDVGANSGVYAKELREAGYKGRIFSFEPLSSAYSKLLKNIHGDASWQAFNMALGDKCGKTTINVAGNSYSSSILEMLPAHLQSAPGSGYVGQEQVDLSTLDSLFNSLGISSKNICLKIDTQGFEEKVLKGAANSLRHINTIQLEMSLTPLYDGELLFPEMHALLSSKGYQLVFIELGFEDSQTARLLQIDGIFHRF